MVFDKIFENKGICFTLCSVDYIKIKKKREKLGTAKKPGWANIRVGFNNLDFTLCYYTKLSLLFSLAKCLLFILG